MGIMQPKIWSRLLGSRDPIISGQTIFEFLTPIFDQLHNKIVST